jgi:hypothetical protein
MKIIDTQGERICIKDRVTQGELEAFEVAYAAEAKETVAQTRGATLRAAVVAGWVIEPVWSEEQVNRLDAQLVRTVSEQVADLWLTLSSAPAEESN